MSTFPRRAIADSSLWAAVDSCWAALASEIRRGRPGLARKRQEDAAREGVQVVAFLQLCRQRGLLPSGTTKDSLATVRERFGPALLPTPSEPVDDEALAHAVATLPNLVNAPDVLGQLHQRLLGRQLAQAPDGSWRVEPSVEARKAAASSTRPTASRDTSSRTQAGLAVQPEPCILTTTRTAQPALLGPKNPRPGLWVWRVSVGGLPVAACGGRHNRPGRATPRAARATPRRRP